MKRCTHPPTGLVSFVRNRVAIPAIAALTLACGSAAVPVDPVPARPHPERVDPLPTVRVEQVAGGQAIVEPGAAGEPLGEPVVVGPGERVTLTAVGTDLRALLAALAEAAGVSLVVGPAVEGRVTAHFDDVPARAALERVVAESGLMIARPLRAPYPPTVFYVVPVNVNEAEPATIEARFGVSAELARFLVRSRIPAPSDPPPN